MADEVRFAPGQRTPPARLFTSESARGGLGKRRPHSSGLWSTVFGKLSSHFLHSNVRSARPSGPCTIPTSIMRQVDGTPLFNFAHGRRINERRVGAGLLSFRNDNATVIAAKYPLGSVQSSARKVGQMPHLRAALIADAWGTSPGLVADSGTGDGWQITRIAAEQFRTLSKKKFQPSCRFLN
jgi:hypothetical protein